MATFFFWRYIETPALFGAAEEAGGQDEYCHDRPRKR
jgi:hypothetical protein